MSSVDVFYIVGSMSFVVIAGGVIYLGLRINRTLNEVDKIIAEVKSVASDLEIFRSGLKMGLVSLISALVSKLRMPSAKPKEVTESE